MLNRRIDVESRNEEELIRRVEAFLFLNAITISAKRRCVGNAHAMQTREAD